MELLTNDYLSNRGAEGDQRSGGSGMGGMVGKNTPPGELVSRESSIKTEKLAQIGTVVVR